VGARVVGVAGGQGFIGARVVQELGADALAFGREGAPGVAFDAMVWAAGRRSNDTAELEAAHVAAPLAALARVRAGGRFVYLGSGEVYGPAQVPFRETQAPDPRSGYALAKLRGENALASAAAAADVTLIVLRLAVVYGPGQAGTMLLPSLLAALRAGRRVPMTRGEQTRDFVHVDDVAAAVRAALAEGAHGGLYNVGSGAETRVADAALALARLVGGEAAVALVGLGELPYREGEQMRYLLDGGRARAALGFVPHVALADGLARLASS
jgi:nucleoside-diphosphate-sugar epimerase